VVSFLTAYSVQRSGDRHRLSFGQTLPHLVCDWKLMMDNISYIEELYSEWEKDPSSVDSQWDMYFRKAAEEKASKPDVVPTAGAGDMAYRQSRVDSMLWAYRDIGYLYARLNPLGGDYGPEHDYLNRMESVSMKN
jgi:2-oxoglutarate dehydrogenase complex dehydrogenase (E1) component-like enzyme